MPIYSYTDEIIETRKARKAFLVFIIYSLSPTFRVFFIFAVNNNIYETEKGLSSFNVTWFSKRRKAHGNSKFGGFYDLKS